jgi:hypothetical protein
MWPFNSEEEIHVHSSTLQLFRGGILPSMVETAVAEMVFEGKDFGDSLLESAVNSKFSFFDNFLRYGEESYYLGLPTFQFADNDSIVTEVVPSLGINVDDVIYARLDNINLAHVVWQKLTEDYGYDHDDNTLQYVGLPEGTVGYIDEVVIHVPGFKDGNIPITYTWEGTHTGGESPARVPGIRRSAVKVEELSQGAPYAVITVAYLDASSVAQSITFNITFDAYDTGSTYYMVHYLEDGVHTYFTYLLGSGTYPALDSAPTDRAVYLDLGKFYPIVPFISDGTYLADDSLVETEEYKQRVEMLRKLGLQYKDLGESIINGEGAEDLQQAVLQLGIPLVSDVPLEMEYLFEFWDKLYENLQVQDLVSSTNLRSIKQGNVKEYVLNYTEGDFDMSITFQNIYRNTIPGTIGDVGECTNGTFTEKSYVGSSSGLGISTVTKQARRLQKQVTEGLYVEIVIVAPTQIQTIYRNKKQHIRYEDDRFIIPLDRDIVDKLPIYRRDSLLQSSIHFVVNAYQVQTIEWYEQDWFRFALIVIAVVLTIYSLGATWEALAAAWAIGTTAFVIAVLSIFLKAIIIQFVFKWVAKKLGPEWALVIAVIAAIASIWGGEDGLLSAENLMVTSNSLVVAANSVNQEEIESILKQQEQLELLNEERSDDLKEIKELLSNSNFLDPFAFIGQNPLEVPAEEPGQFYHRTIHNNNPGTLCYDYLHNYFDVNLELPKPDLE